MEKTYYYEGCEIAVRTGQPCRFNPMRRWFKFIWQDLAWEEHFEADEELEAYLNDQKRIKKSIENAILSEMESSSKNFWKFLRRI